MPNHRSPMQIVADVSDEFSESGTRLKSGKRRIWIFVGVFLISLLNGLAYVWVRQPVYMATASVLTVAPDGVDEIQVKDFDQYSQAEPNDSKIRWPIRRQLPKKGGIQHVSIQKQILLGIPILEGVQKRLKQKLANESVQRVSLDDLQWMLSVEPVPETNLIELRAEGHEANILAEVVNSWLAAYQEAREKSVINSKENTTAALEGEKNQLERKIGEKRQELDQFRRAHDILTKNGADNQAMARLSGLNNALNKASEDEVKAKAKLDAVKEALAKGKPVLSPEEQQSLVNLEQRAQQLRELLKDIKQRYTSQYIALQPKLKLIPEQLAQTEAEIKKKIEGGQRAALSEAEQEHASARQAIVEVKRQISGHKREAAEFTAKFSEYQAMAEELEQLEYLQQQNQMRLTEIAAKQIEKFPQLEVVERAYPPTKPIGPDYWKDSGIAFIASIGVSLVMTLLYDFLLCREGSMVPIKLPEVRVFSVTEDLLLRHQQDALQVLPQQLPDGMAGRGLENFSDTSLPRELAAHEIQTILESATPLAQKLIGLILSGLTLEEIAELNVENFDLDNSKIKIGDSGRVLPLAKRLKCWLNQTLDQWREGSDLEELVGVIGYAMADSGIFQPETADAAALRHTYIMYLVRQGIRLADLEQVVGRLSAKTLARYAKYSPPGPGLKAEAVSLVYPLLNEEQQV